MKLAFLRRPLALLLALVLAGSLLTLPVGAAEEEEDDEDEGYEVPVYDITLSPTELTLEAGKTSDLTCTISPSYATDQTLTWTSSDDSIASVVGSGKSATVTAKKTGKATIKVENAASKKSATCTVNVVTYTHAEHIYITSTKLSLGVGEDINLPGRDVFPTASTDQIEWKIADTTIVNIVNNKLHGLAVGETTLTAYSVENPDADCNVCTITVTPAKVNKVTIDQDKLHGVRGNTFELTATVDCTDETSTVTWQSTNDQVARVSPTEGLKTTVTIVGNTPGATAAIIATSKTDPSKYAVCMVSVDPPTVSSATDVEITTPKANAYVDPGSTMQLAATPIPVESQEKIVWVSDDKDEKIAKVVGNGEKGWTATVTGIAPGKTTISAYVGGTSGPVDTIDIEVSGILLSRLKSSASGGAGTTEQLTANSVIEIPKGRDVSVNYVVYGAAKSKTINWDTSNPSIASVVGGRVTGNYAGENVTITASVAGTSYSAKFLVRVVEDTAETISVSIGSNAFYNFSSLVSQLNSRSQSKAGAPLDNIYNVKVTTANGALYYKYGSPETPGHAVGGTETYYYSAGQGQMALRDLTFVPAAGLNGVAEIEYTALATNGTTFTGMIRIQVTANGTISYTSALDQPVKFSASHFSDACQGRNGRALSYVTFDLPYPSQGTLYYDYNPNLYSTKVSNSTRYYASSNPSIDNITFVPAEGYSGTVYITYHCTDSSGASFSGTISIDVNSSSTSSGGNVEYSTGVNQNQRLYDSDFNSASRRVTNTALNYIRFNSLPSTRAGRLYLNYSSSSGNGTQVATDRNYYRGSTPGISDITFVPASGYSGTVTIPYTGINTSGTSYNGNLIIYVGNSGNRIYYYVGPNQSVAFRASDFNAACRSVTGDTLNYVIFNLPSSSYGKLYYRYDIATRTGTAASSTAGYYYSGSTRLLDDLSFAATSTTGTTSFSYTAYSVRGESFTGRVQIQISSGDTASGVIGGNIHYAGGSAPIPFRSSDFQSACQATLGTTLASVLFERLPDIGHLYQDYSGPAQTGTDIISGERYGLQDLDRISYLPKAQTQGLVAIPFTAFDAQGGTYSGTVSIQLSASYSASPFTDVYNVSDLTRSSIEFLRLSGITTGYSDGTFRPNQSISRGEFTLMVCRAFQFPTTGTSGFPDVPANSVYAGAVASARNLGIVQGNNGRFQPDLPITRQSAITMIYRAMNAAGMSVPAAPTTLLSSYYDGARISQFAQPAVAALIQLGAVKGTTDMRLNPGTAISRAEMAVILHRVLAQ